MTLRVQFFAGSGQHLVFFVVGCFVLFFPLLYRGRSGAVREIQRFRKGVGFLFFSARLKLREKKLAFARNKTVTHMVFRRYRVCSSSAEDPRESEIISG